MSNTANIRRLNLWVDDVAEQLNLAVSAVAQHLALDSWSKLTDRTPVDLGRAQASWGIGQGEPSSWLPPEGVYSRPADPDVSWIDGTTTVFVTSNLVYMEALENGHSKQAPFGMVRIVIAELQAELEVAIQDL